MFNNGGSIFNIIFRNSNFEVQKLRVNSPGRRPRGVIDNEHVIVWVVTALPPAAIWDETVFPLNRLNDATGLQERSYKIDQPN